jgi:hypothetical protein
MNNFLHMKNRDRLKLVLFVMLFVGAALLFPVLLSVKVDGDLSARYVTRLLQ